MSTIKDFQARVNPIYTTGKGTAGSLAKAGNRDAVSIVSKMDLSELKEQAGGVTVPEIIRQGYAVALEARYEISNEMILRENHPWVIDLPSGYTPRAFRIAREGKHYLGFDLPVVADDIGPIVAGLLPPECKGLAEYHGVDATNYDSMRAALDSVDGSVCIATDGLLGYFNEPELLAMCENVKRILRRFGGSWITGDVTNEVIYAATFRLLLRENPDMLQAFSMTTASKMADVEMKQNSLYNGGTEKALEFLHSQGFEVERISYAGLMPSLVSLAGKPETEQQLREAYRDIEMWKMTLRQDEKRIQEEVKGESFSADLSLSGEELRIALGGRLDTISAPELLAKYEHIVKGQAVSSVMIDARNLQYVSSAGLRVMLIIYKALDRKENFSMLNVSSEVREILEVTGFDQFFL